MTPQNEIKNLEKTIAIQFPNLYVSFLEKIPQGEVYDITNTGICFYSCSDLIERNTTYEIREYDSDYFMIGQDGDKGYFINAKDPTDETIYSNDLGAIGSLAMEKEFGSIFELVEKYKC